MNTVITTSAVAKEVWRYMTKRIEDMTIDDLTQKQRAWLEAFNGDPTEAAKIAGYSSHTCQAAGYKNSQHPVIVKEIRRRESERLRPLIATREERQAFWTSIMNDNHKEMKHRLKSSELLGRSEGDFLERVELSGDVTIDRADRLSRARERIGNRRGDVEDGSKEIRQEEQGTTGD